MYAPKRSCIIKERSYPWVTDNIKLMMKLRDDALSVYRKSELECKKIFYKDLKSLVSKSLFYEKAAY